MSAMPTSAPPSPLKLTSARAPSLGIGGFRGCGKTQVNCHSEEPAGDEESRIALKTCGARSFAAAQDGSIGTFFRSLFSPEALSSNSEHRPLLHLERANFSGRTSLAMIKNEARRKPFKKISSKYVVDNKNS